MEELELSDFIFKCLFLELLDLCVCECFSTINLWSWSCLFFFFSALESDGFCFVSAVIGQTIFVALAELLIDT